MAILTNEILVAAQTPASPDVVGGGLIVAVWLGTGGNGVTYALEASQDEGTTWYPVGDEGGTAIVITYVAGGQMAQINPPVRAPFFRLRGVTAAEADAALDYEVHTV